MHNCPDEDRREPEQIESWARDVLNPHLDGRLVVWDDNSEDSMWDFCLVGDDGDHLGSVEVTRSTDQAFKEFYIHLDVAGEIWEAPAGATWCWTLLLRPHVNPLKVDRHTLGKLLLFAQSNGFEKVTPYSPRPLRDLINEVEAAAVWKRHTCPDGPDIHVQPIGQSWTGDHQVTRSLVAEASNNAEKLITAPEPRHLLIWIEIENMAATFGIAEAPPDLPVLLPGFLDFGWAAAGAGNPDKTALWRVASGDSWSVVQPFPTRSVEDG